MFKGTMLPLGVDVTKAAKSIATEKTQRFRAVLERGAPALGWTIARVPFDPAKTWTDLLRLRIRGEINGVAFRSSLFPHTDKGYFLLVNRAMQLEAGVAVGGTAEFVIAPDLDARPAALSDELEVLLEDEPGLRAWYDSLSEYTRREIGKWCAGVKSDEARMRRAQQMAERLLSTMEAERELPPAITHAFRLRPKAATGWARLTAAQRRAELMGVFYYQTPEARERRIAKLCELAEKKA